MKNQINCKLDCQIFTVINSSPHGFTSNQQNDQLPLNILAQLVEQCIGIGHRFNSRLLSFSKQPKEVIDV